MKIKCSICGKVVKVFGYIWNHRLRFSEKDLNGNYIGWNCDNCVDCLENGRDCYE